MRNEQDYIRDLNEIRSMMERSTKFLSLSGWAGIMAGIYALAGAIIAYTAFGFEPDGIVYSPASGQTEIIFLALAVLVLALFTAIFLSKKRADRSGEKIWNATSRRLLGQMAVPLTAGGILIAVLISSGMWGLAAPLTLIFYGLALFNAGNMTIDEVKYLGFAQTILGLTAAVYIQYGLILWTLGFGAAHIVYGIYMHFRYER